MRNPAQPMVGIYTQVKVGSAREDYRTSGMSHMLEHLLFNGSEKWTQEELYALADRRRLQQRQHHRFLHQLHDGAAGDGPGHRPGAAVPDALPLADPGGQVRQGAGHRPGRDGAGSRLAGPRPGGHPAPGPVRRLQPGTADPGHPRHHRPHAARRCLRLLQRLVRAQQHDADRGGQLRPGRGRGPARELLRRAGPGTLPAAPLLPRRPSSRPAPSPAGRGTSASWPWPSRRPPTAWPTSSPSWC